MRSRTFLAGLWLFSVSFVFPNGIHGQENSAKADSLLRLIQNHYLNDGSYSKELTDALSTLSEEHPEDKTLLAKSIYWKTLVSYSHSSNDAQLDKQIDSLLGLSDFQKDRYSLMLLTHASALAKMTHGNFPEAFRNALEAHRLALELKDSSFTHQTALMLGNIGPYIQDYEISRHYYDIAEQYMADNPQEKFKLYLNRSRLLFLLGEYDSAINLLSNQMASYRDTSSRSLLAVANLNLGSYLSALERKDSAVRHYRTALELMKGVDNKNFLLAIYGNIGNYYRYQERYDSAMFYYRKARNMAKEDNNLDQYASLAYEMSLLFTTVNQNDSAYIYLKEYNELTDRIQRPQTIESYRDYVDMVMESSDNQIKISRQEISLKNKQLAIIACTSAGIVVAVVLVLMVALERRRSARQYALLKEIENKELSDQLEHEQQIKQLQEEKMEQKVREITSYSLLVANKNNLLEKIRDSLSHLNESSPKETANRINRLIDESLHTDGEYWKQFVVHFTQVDPHFFDLLKSKYPNLTPNETKLCAYIRIGMTSKQIAQMLNLTPESVNKNRYRLRKKFDLEKDIELDDFIKKL